MTRRYIGDVAYTVVALAVIIALAMGVWGIAPHVVALVAGGSQ